jgi:hypothetical protein
MVNVYRLTTTRHRNGISTKEIKQIATIRKTKAIIYLKETKLSLIYCINSK